ncbi:glycosyltransferase family 4 protein [Cyanobacterium sp. Dongsha4]|uniref:glycosyltransferase family 4 protein n=1 Tax=Cyanobacterium sp. DS4 TaxID=2878255 RepID=UPI002E81D803|nr:glycosyltransferase family 4 protein [Cyanobacterium sp. Dongsha4]WVL00861.1 glycosyltransferase family 4 protein [Cyanobacterium sp. Dongsha4]
MRILVLSWEFPPRIVGGIARHVAELYPEIVKLNNEVHLITVRTGDSPILEQVEGINVHRLEVIPEDDFFRWIIHMNNVMRSYAEDLISQMGGFDLIHAHDWLVADSAIPLKHRFKIPLITTIHATEYGRHNGIHNETQAYIASKEGTLIYESWRVIVCSDYMRFEVHRALGCPKDKIDIIYNGIRPEKKARLPQFDSQKFRRKFAQDDEKIIYYVGRMTYEKGIHVLLKAAGKVLQDLNGKVKLVIIGGGNTDFYQDLAHSLGIWQHCNFTGFMSEEDLNKFTTIADCAVFPSLYEPFGIVVLESFASRVPVVVSDAGGLPEVVRHTNTGIVTQVNNPHSLAWGILEILKNPDYAQSMIKNAYQDLFTRFQWSKLAQQTIDTYGIVARERQLTIWE